jgi:hypothetical protein
MLLLLLPSCLLASSRVQVSVLFELPRGQIHGQGQPARMNISISIMQQLQIARNGINPKAENKNRKQHKWKEGRKKGIEIEC